MASVTDALRTLDERARREREAREARATAVRDAVRVAVRERSDVDLVVSGVAGAPLRAVERAAERAAGVTVDLLDLEALPADFQARVLAEGLPLHD